MIRQYGPDDLEKIVDIANRAWAGIHAAYKAAYGDELFDILIPDPETRKGQEVRAFSNEHPDWVFVCEESGTVVGFVTFTLDCEKRIGTICNNAADPDCGLKGIGRQMYSAVLDTFREEGMIYARVQTGLDEGHAPARCAYERAGFNISHGMLTYYMKLE